MSTRSHSFEINSVWEFDCPKTDLKFVIDKPQEITHWWAAVFLKVELLSGNYYAPSGLVANLWTKGFLPHSFKFKANIFHNRQHQQLIIKTMGDFSGIGTITIQSLGANKSQIHINWRTNVENHTLYLLMMLLKPIFIANHKWAMRKGFQGLKYELLRRQTKKENATPPRQKPTFPHNLLVKKANPF